MAASPCTKARRGGGSNMNPVFSLVERDGDARSVHMPNVRVENLGAALDNHASGKSDLMTDEAAAFTQLGWNFALASIRQSQQGRIRAPRRRAASSPPTASKVSSRSSNAEFMACISTSAKRTCTATSHEFDFRYSNRERLGVNDVARASRALVGAKGRRLTYETTNCQRALKPSGTSSTANDIGTGAIRRQLELPFGDPSDIDQEILC